MAASLSLADRLGSSLGVIMLLLVEGREKNPLLLRNKPPLGRNWTRAREKNLIFSGSFVVSLTIPAGMKVLAYSAGTFGTGTATGSDTVRAACRKARAVIARYP
jgi:hypothetical protein